LIRYRQSLPAFAAGFVAGYAAWCAVQAVTPRSARGRSPSQAQGSRSFVPHDDQARSYGREQRAFAVAGSFRSLAGTACAAFGENAAIADRIVGPLPPAIGTPAYAAALCVLDAMLELPVGYIEDYRQEQRYGLNTQSLSNWLSDSGKALALETIVAALLAALLGTLVRKYPRTWPAIAAARAVTMNRAMIRRRNVSPWVNVRRRRGVP